MREVYYAVSARKERAFFTKIARAFPIWGRVLCERAFCERELFWEGVSFFFDLGERELFFDFGERVFSVRVLISKKDIPIM